jgi:ABC-type transport system involved in multi-copper enzyme maturation permease subunit
MAAISTRDPVRDLGRWLWYLLPANPILLRVVLGSGRRLRHLGYRSGYLGVLFFVFLTGFFAHESADSLAALAKSSTQTFQFVAIAQLLLMCFLAPVFTAGAITQERDAETYNILLTTPLSNAQIILGSLFSRLFFVFMLLFSGLPIFCITMIYGGVTLRHILLSAAIAGSTALITGSLAIMVSMIKIGTRRTIFSFFLFIGLYLMAIYALGRWSVTALPEAPLAASGSRRMSWLTALHPFLSLEVSLGRVPAPPLADVAHYGWPIKYLLASPHLSYCALTALASLGLILVSMIFVRRGAREGEQTLLNRMSLRRRRAGNGDRRRLPRRVWANPVAWREAVTRASGGSSTVLRYGMIAAGILASLGILFQLIRGAIGPAQARYFLCVLIGIEFVLILLVATSASATSMTKERESNTLDIMMTTPLTSEQIVWGKLRGLISYTAPLLVLPVLNMLVFGLYDLATIGRAAPRVIQPEALVLVAAVVLVYTAVACAVGMQTSLKSKRTVQSVLVAISIMTGLCGLSYLIGDQIVQEAADAGPVLAPLTPFTAVKMLVDPTLYNLNAGGGVRIMTLIGVVLACGGWGGVVVFGMYRSLVRNFYMTLRKQTAS